MPVLKKLGFGLLVLVPALWLVGPRWPGTYDRLLCGDTWSERAIFPDRPTCEVAMNAATEPCVCEDVRGSWSPFYYIVLIPVIAIHGVLFLAHRTAIGMAAVLATVFLGVTVVPLFVFALYAASVRIPLLLQNMAIVWPQVILFPNALQSPAGRLIPYEMSDWAFPLSMIVWAILGIAFGALVQRVSSLKLVAGLAIVFVAVVSYALLKVAPLVGWKYTFEFP
jgi:hypothetical protein